MIAREGGYREFQWKILLLLFGLPIGESLMAERRAMLLCQAYPQAATARCVSPGARPAHYHQPVRRETNDNPKPFGWTADPNRIIAAVNPWKHVIESVD